ncbi:MAG: hypothetical protein ACYTG5_14120 [Planctomycetota bacterium]|jgi:hypothetical protein
MAYLLAGVLALVGLVIIFDASLSSGPSGYRLIAWVLALALVLPLGSILLLQDRALRLWKLLGFAAVPAAVLLLVGEIALRLSGFSGASVVLMPDPILGHRLSASSPDADGWGFRNSSVPERSDVVCIDDSQVFGFGVAPQETLPAQFAQMSGASSYSMSLGGYGPVQYLSLCKQALELEPKLLVLGLYLGNDILDAHLYACLESASSLRNPGINYEPYQAVELRGKDAPNLAMALVDGVRERSAVAEASATMLRDMLFVQSELAELYSIEPGAPRHEGGGIPTLFTPEYRLTALNLDDERVLDGLRITSLCLQDIAVLCKEAAVVCMLLVIPSKEAVYARVYDQSGFEDPGLRTLAEAEALVTERVIAVARESGMMVVDPRRALAQALLDQDAMWPSSADGHPTAAGYGRLASEVLASWRQSGWKGPR